jgi:ferredoxin
MKITADKVKCIGSGQCVLTEPRLFDQSDEDSTVLLLNDAPDDELIDQARQAVHLCPSQALSLHE